MNVVCLAFCACACVCVRAVIGAHALSLAPQLLILYCLAIDRLCSLDSVLRGLDRWRALAARTPCLCLQRFAAVHTDQLRREMRWDEMRTACDPFFCMRAAIPSTRVDIALGAGQGATPGRLYILWACEVRSAASARPISGWHLYAPTLRGDDLTALHSATCRITVAAHGMFWRSSTVCGTPGIHPSELGVHN